MQLTGQTALVTGAGRGIGLAIALELARQGSHVALVARTRGQLDDAAAEVNQLGNGRAIAYLADVRDHEAIAAVAATAEQELGPITALINNAGTPGPAGDEWTVDPAAWWECIESIVRGAFNCTQAVVPRMITRGRGRIINIASVTGTTPWPLVSATSTAKTALIRQTENLAAATAEHGIHAFAVHPGLVRTDLLLSYRTDQRLRDFIDSAPEEAFSPPQLAGTVAARIMAGELDALSGRFIDATSDLDNPAGRSQPHADDLTLRIVGR